MKILKIVNKQRKYFQRKLVFTVHLYSHTHLKPVSSRRLEREDLPKIDFLAIDAIKKRNLSRQKCNCELAYLSITK